MAKSVFFLKGSKVVLKPFLLADINDTYIKWLNDSNIVKFSNQRFFTHTVDSCIRYQKSFNGTDSLFLSISRLSDDLMIGTITAHISINHRTADMGIMIGDQSLWGLGYGFDAWNTFSNWLLYKNLRKLTAGTLACNYGMIKLMERSGMHLEATRKAQEIVEESPVDMLHYAKFNVN